jgi:hypothetical protein
MNKPTKYALVTVLTTVIVALFLMLDVIQVLYLSWAAHILYGWYFLPYGFAPLEYFVFVGALGLAWIAQFRFDKHKQDVKLLTFGKRLLRLALFPLIILGIFWTIKYFFM